jgi:cell division septal protein FtsQ
MRVSAPADRRFRRAHVHPARKRSWLPPWRRLIPALVVCGVAGYLVYRASELLLAAEALMITRITVQGANRMSNGEVLAVLHGLRGRNMLTVDLEAWRKRLLASPWVGDAVMRRVFPGTVAVVISEREPLGLGRVGGGLYLIDHGGTIIDEFGPGYAEFDLPIIDGLAAAPGRGGPLVDDARARLAGRLLAALQPHPELAGRVSQIDVSDARDAVVILKDDTALVHVGDERFAERLQSYLGLAARLRETVPRIDYVDVRYEDRVYVKPVGAGARAQ